MISPLPNSPTHDENVSTARPGAAIARFGMAAVIVAFFALAGLFLLVREVVVPRVHEYRPQIVAALEHAIGLPVSIDALSADWSGLRPRLHLSGLRILDANGNSALRLDRVDATVAWSSLLRGQAHFDRLVLISPELALKRTADGQVFVAGVRIDPHARGGELPEWLLAQREVVIQGATVSWSDELRGAPALRLSDVDFRLSRQGARYRFGIRSNPPAEIAAMLDVRGDLVSIRPGDPATWAGQIYVALDGADLGAWNAWVDYPVPLDGLGGLRAWIDVIDGMPRILTANVALDDVSTRLSEGLPELRLRRVRGSFSGKRVAGGYEFTARSMAFAGDEDLQFGPTDLDLTIRDIANIQQSGGTFKASTLDIGVLARLAAHLPFGDKLRDGLETFGPSGTFQNLSFEWNGQAGSGPSWSARTRFSGLGLSPHGVVPGIQGFSGELAGDHDSGRFTLAGSDAAIDLPAVFPEARLAFASIQAEGGWTRRSGRLEFMLDGARFENADAAGSASGRYFPVEGGRGEIDLAARLTRAEGPSVWRYLPWVVNEYTRNWLRGALTEGFVPDARLRLKGNLDEFPFEDGQSGQFLVTVRVAGANLDYAAGWPAIGAIDAELRFEGPGMRISADRASILGVTLADVVADVPHLDQPGGAVMHLKGSAMGPTQEFLRFVSASPVAARIDGFTDHMTAEGRGALDLTLVMPLGDIDDTQVAGEFRFTGNRLGVIEGLPALTDATGRVLFTRDELTITDARARALGEPLRLSAHTPQGGGVRFSVEGGAAMRALTQFLDWPILSHLSGTSAWKAEIDLRPKLAEVVVTSALTGLSSSLPYPLNKRANAAWPFKFELAMRRDGRGESIRVELGDIGTAEVMGRRGEGGWEVERGGIGLFSPVATAQGGIMLSAVVDELDLDAWRRVLGRGDEAPGYAAADGRWPIAGVDLSASRMRVLGRELTALELGVLGDDGGWKGRISSDQASGSFDWRSADEGSLKARFERLTIDAEEGDAALTGDAPADEPLRNLPALDIVADTFVLRGLDLGRLELKARNEDGLWTLNTLRIDNPEGDLNASGQWRSGRDSLTELAFRLETRNIGQFLARLGYPEAVRGGNAILSGGIEWRGAPTRIHHPSLSGAVALEAYKGQFRKLEPGVGRLLGVLSLQSLPRRLTLDFRDVFSEGFAFESISGSIAMASGVMRTDDLRIAGPAARIWITGSADVERETQDLAVLVQPTLSESVAVGAAAGLINPMAGVIAYLAQKVLSDPIERMFAFGYAITGSWADPVVEKVPVGPQSQQEKASGEQ
ncbi:MAG TPA: YhdP family protein [Rhodocyclaceae bacterium]|nr:YhdP family protein [Rhodocyclaceae bacterium]